MKNTYTYTARSAEHPEKIVTFTLYEGRMLVGIGAPMEQIAQVAGAIQARRTAAEDAEAGADTPASTQPQLWLKPVAVSLAQWVTTPFRVVDVNARLADRQLSVYAWVRVGGLRLFPLSLMTGDIDNPAAAKDFVAEVKRRKEARRKGPAFLSLFDYWGTWIVATGLVVGLFNFWRQKTYDEG